MSTDAASTPPERGGDACPFGPLPRLSGRQLRLERALRPGTLSARVSAALGWLVEALGGSLRIGAGEILARPSGLRRPGLTIRLGLPDRSTRLALGLETPLVHGLVDRLLGFERPPGEGRRPTTPVERGLLAFVVARTLAEFTDPADAPVLVLDHVGPEPFAPNDLGPIVTLRWAVRIGRVAGSARLWLPESLALTGLGSFAEAPDPGPVALDPAGPLGRVTGHWRAEAGTVTLPGGLARLRVGSVQPLDGSPLTGTPASPTGPVALCLRDRSDQFVVPAACAPHSGGGRLIVTGKPRRDPLPREALSVPPPSPTGRSGGPPTTGQGDSAPPSPTPPPQGLAPADVPVTLVVELGRINLPVVRVAALRPGDVLELGRHSREPVELTSGGRLVARGELVQIDKELGVLITSVFF